MKSIEEFKKLFISLKEKGWIIEGCKSKFHKDSGRVAWNFYKKVYKIDKEDALSIMAGLNKVCFSTLKPCVNYSGDCDFSFNSEKDTYKKFITSLTKLGKKYHNQADRIEIIKIKLDYCSKIHHSIVNISLAPTISYNEKPRSGSLNQKKGNRRFDKYIKSVNSYYGHPPYKESLDVIEGSKR